MFLPEYVLSWLKECDASTEPIDTFMVSDLVVTRLREHQSTEAEIRAFTIVLAPLDFGVRPNGGSSWGLYFAPKYEKPVEYPPLAELNAVMVDEWAELVQALNNPVLKARFADAVWEL